MGHNVRDRAAADFSSSRETAQSAKKIFSTSFSVIRKGSGSNLSHPFSVDYYHNGHETGLVVGSGHIIHC